MSDEPAAAARIELRKLTPDLAALHDRLDDGDRKFVMLEKAIAANTALTAKVFENTKGFIAFANEMEAGTKLFCRVAMGVKFILKDVVDPYWKPALVCFVAGYLLFSRGHLPQWISDLIKLLMP